MPYELTEAERDRYRATSVRSRLRKQQLLARHEALGPQFAEATGKRFDPYALMPRRRGNKLSALSLFTGGGGLDLGFERAGFKHQGSFEILDICGETIRTNRPKWSVNAGADVGDVRSVRFSQYRGIDVVHGGPPCQPFSIAGKQEGADDPRNMWAEFVRCVRQARPRAFVAENVPGMLDRKFDEFVRRHILEAFDSKYKIFKFKLAAHDFGVPQNRRRVFFVGFRAARDAAKWVEPVPTHGGQDTMFCSLKEPSTARQALGLPDIGHDEIAPTLRSGFTGPRKTTGVVNSKASLKVWSNLRIWPHGVQRSRSIADAYPPENGHFRLSVGDCALLQGFPSDWIFKGAVYQALGQIGNSVCPPVAYAVARNVALALKAS